MMIDFIKEYFEQDNFGTAYPIYFVIRDVEWVSSYHQEEGDRFVYVYDDGVAEQADTLINLFAKIKNSKDFEFPKNFDFDYPGCFEIEEFIEANGNIGGIYAEIKKYKEENMFLLKSEADSHLKANYYHYSKEAHVFCKHAWRAPRQAKFFEELKESIK